MLGIVISQKPSKNFLIYSGQCAPTEVGFLCEAGLRVVSIRSRAHLYRVELPAIRSRAFGVGYPAIRSRAFGVGHPAIWSRAFRVGYLAIRSRAYQ